MTKYYLPRPVENIEGQKYSCKRRNVIPTILISFFMSASIFLGFSFLIIPEGYVGYFECDNCTIEKIYSSGLHLDFPWNRGFVILDVSYRNITVNDSYVVCFKISNERVYINRVRSLGSVDRFDQELGDRLRKRDLDHLETQGVEVYKVYKLNVHLSRNDEQRNLTSEPTRVSTRRHSRPLKIFTTESTTQSFESTTDNLTSPD